MGVLKHQMPFFLHFDPIKLKRSIQLKFSVFFTLSDPFQHPFGQLKFEDDLPRNLLDVPVSDSDGLIPVIAGYFGLVGNLTEVPLKAGRVAIKIMLLLKGSNHSISSHLTKYDTKIVKDHL